MKTSGNYQMRETGEMTKAAVSLFVRLWRAEYKITVEHLEASEQLDTAVILGKPSARFASKVKSTQSKINALNKKIEAHVFSGLFPANAAATCRDQLGEIYGYVADSYHAVCEDCRFEQAYKGE